MSMDLKQYVTTKQAAELLGIRQDSVHHLIVSERVKAMKIGNSWLVFRPSIEKYFQTKSSSGKPTSRQPKLSAPVE